MSIRKHTMTALTLAVMVCLTSTALSGTIAYRDLILSDNPIVYYELDETSGSTASNSATRGATYDGTFNTAGGLITVNQASFAQGGTAYDFGGGFIGSASALTNSLTEWTVEAWVNYDSAKNSGSTFFSNDQGDWNNDVQYGIGVEGGTSGVPAGSVGMTQQSPPEGPRDYVTSALAADEWHHVVMTGSTAAGELKLYIDGALVNTDASLANGVTFNGADGLGTAHLSIGAARPDSGDAGYRSYDGFLDELAVYNRALDASEVLEHYQLAVNDTGVADISVVPSSLDFGSVEALSLSNLSVVVSNAGPDQLIISGFTYDDGTKYSVLESAPIYVASGGTISLTVRYSPGGVAGTHNDMLHIVSNDPDSTTTNITLHGVRGTMPPMTDYATAILAEDGLVAYYRLNEITGTVATNAEGTAALDGSYEGSPTLTAAGPRPDAGFAGFEADNTAMSHAGASLVGAKVRNSSLGTLTSWTLEAWANSSDVDAHSANSDGQHIFSRDEGGYGNDVLIGLHPFGSQYTTLGHWDIHYQYPNPETLENHLDPSKATSGQWYHVVATYDNASRTMTLYINGVQTVQTSGLGARPLTGIGDLWIGGYWLGSVTRGFVGTVDEAAVYNRALDAGEVLMHYSFATLSAGTPPVIDACNPVDGAGDVFLFANLEATFNELMALTGAGTVTIRNLTIGAGADVTIALPDTRVSISGSDLSINPSVDLDSETDYAVRISGAAVNDLSGNPFGGIGDDTTWNFRTAVELPEGSVAPGAWSLVLLPDTQNYAMSYPGIYGSQTAWIRDNVRRRNIRYVLHLGDMTNNNTDEQWKRARAAVGVLDGVVPYAIVGGNHDYGPDGNASTRDTLMNDYFSYSEAASQPTFGGAMETGKLDNTYHLFEAGGVQWIIFNFEWAPRDTTIAWARGIYDLYPTRKGILVTHAYLYSDNTRYDITGPSQSWNPHYSVYSTPGTVNDGQELWDKFVNNYNFALTLNGHVLNDGTGYRVDTNLAGNAVHQMLINYQMRSLGGEGYMRIIEFQPDGQTVKVTSFSTVYDSFLTAADHQFEFALPLGSVDVDADGMLDYFDPDFDTDNDGVSNYEEFVVSGTHSDKTDSDGDGIGDDEEIAAGTDPLRSDAGTVDLIQSDPVGFELFTEQMILDLNPGIAFRVDGDEVSFDLQMRRSGDLSNWFDEGAPVNWTMPKPGDKQFYRIQFDEGSETH